MQGVLRNVKSALLRRSQLTSRSFAYDSSIPPPRNKKVPDASAKAKNVDPIPISTPLFRMANPELYLNPREKGSWYWVYAVWGVAAVYFPYSYATGGLTLYKTEPPQKETEKCS